MIFRTGSLCSRLTTLLCVVLLLINSPLLAQEPVTAPPATPASDAPKLKGAAELDSLVAPIALYPDPLLAQVLAASTYPLEIVQANRWLKENSKLQGEQLTQAATQQNWDPSVQALVAFPDALTLLDNNLKWTTDLGNAVLDQQSDVMDAVQRMRAKAQGAGKLASGKEQTVETKVIESKTIIEIQPADPQVIYVPTYEPAAIYGEPYYPYPPISYPTGGYVAAGLVGFGLGVAVGHYWSGCCGGGWGWNCGWGGNNQININNSFNNRYGYNNINSGNRVNPNDNRWQHNPDHRGAVPYDNRQTAQKFGGTTRDQAGRTERFDNRGQGQGLGGNRDMGNRDMGNRGAGASDRMGNRDIGSGARGQNNAFGGMDSRQRTQAASDRGFNSSRGSASANRGGSSVTRGGGGGASRSYSGGAGRSGGRSGGGRRR